MPKLSSVQARVVRTLELAEEPLSAYSLDCSLATLDALARTGTVQCVNPGALGCGFSPRTVLKWEPLP